ncbi:hypothetical protein J437_LFUL006370, partial [Ladona fulva]
MPSSSSFYDPISPGSSRRSSELSTHYEPSPGNMMNNHMGHQRQEMEPTPNMETTSCVMANQRQMVAPQRRPPNGQMQVMMGPPGVPHNQEGIPSTIDTFLTSNLVVQTQKMSLCGTQQLLEGSGPNHHRLPNPTIASPSRVMAQESTSTANVSNMESVPATPLAEGTRHSGLPEHHPNREVVLEEVGEGEMVENKLVIPDEMVHYLNQ